MRLRLQSVGFNVDRDMVQIGHRDGRSAPSGSPSAATVLIFDLKVVYGNGVPDDLAVKAAIRASGSIRQSSTSRVRRAISSVSN